MIFTTSNSNYLMSGNMMCMCRNIAIQKGKLPF
jgi:hypothetical protein